ncbi:TRAP transporter small permease [uncultured Oscillibacter sp.]|uniref:TRAP transporter small permease n=1 Tax=uncultured Oscillibacter sp. TaxID=876091 RepID=UPI0025F1F1C0|nr:TRAP transporter small permease [uncultured Oscillibacter sp.]
MKKLRKTWDNFEEVVLCLIILVVICVSGLQVACRYLFNNSLTWSEELCRYLFVWTGFLTISLSIKTRSIITIDAFVLFLPQRLRQALSVAAYLFCTAVFAFLAVSAWQIVWGAAGQKSPAMGLPLQWVYVGPLLGFVLSAVRSLGRVVGEARSLLGKEES